MFDGVPPVSNRSRLDRGNLGQRRRVAVVGSGIAGLSAAWFLSRRHDVTLFEAGHRFGGHSRTIDVPVGDHAVAVDTGFIVFTELNYPNLIDLFDQIGVESEESNMSFSVSIDDGSFEYAGGLGLGGYLAQPTNALKPKYWRMLIEIGQFLSSFADGDDEALDGHTLGSLLDERQYSRWFRDRHILPMGAAIWSGTIADLADFPARSFVSFFRTHGLLKVRGRPKWRSVRGGSREYVRRLVAGISGDLRTKCPVFEVTRAQGGVRIRSAAGIEMFDEVVLASHADQTLAILGDPSDKERATLGAFAYRANEAFLHLDRRLMPRRRGAWAAWNYHAASAIDTGAPVGVTYWMNRLQNLKETTPIFVSLNPVRAPRDDDIVETNTFSHPQFDQRALTAQNALPGIQGVQNTWFCGSYCGYGFHEDALVSGMRIAQSLGADIRWSGGTGARPAPASPDLLIAAE